jgi:alpha-N-arabinofuranosidase
MPEEEKPWKPHATATFAAPARYKEQMRLLALGLTLLAGATPAAAAPTLRVDASKPGAQTSRWVTGVNHLFSTVSGKPPANWLEFANEPNPAVVTQARLAHVRLVRFPGGAAANRYDFKAGLGAGRAPCQISGVEGATVPLSNVYGFDEHMRFLEALDGEAQVMVPFAFESARDAADWVEYANAPNDGSNPGGGTDWAALRAANGHPEPYGVTRWEIGNEPDRQGQRYWLSANRDTARRQYVRGGAHRVSDEAADGQCGWALKSNGAPNQLFRTRYAPVRTTGFRLTIVDEVWTRIADLAQAGPNQRVYTLDPQSGAIAFGDGTHGRIPPVGARVYVTYRTSRLPGYDAFRSAMRRIDPDIEVCASWADVRFLRQARADGRRLDCLAVHPYTLLGRYGGVLYNAAHYDAAMKGADAAVAQVRRLQRALRKLPGSPFVAATEYGALAGNAKLEPNSAGSAIHAVYMATEQLAWLRQRVEWALGDRLTDYVFEIVRGAGDRLTPSGEFLRVVGEVPGRRLVRATLRDNPASHGYDVLQALATRGDGGEISILVLNRDREQAVDLRLELPGVTAPRTATVAEATSEEFDSHDSTYDEHEAEVGDGTVLTLPPHSLTRVDLP